MTRHLSSTPAAFLSLLAVATQAALCWVGLPFAPAPAVKFMQAEYEDLPLPGDLRGWHRPPQR